MSRAIAALAAVSCLLLALSTATPASTADPKSPGARSAATADRAGGWRPDVERARNYARSRAGGVSFAFIDLDGRSHKYRAGETAALASVFKTMLLAAYLRQKDVRDRKLRERDRDLLGPMIRASDNETATEVNSILGTGAIERLAKQAGMRRFSYDPTIWGNSRGAPRELARYIQRIDQVIPRRHERYARKLLSSIAPGQRWGVGGGAAEGLEAVLQGRLGQRHGPGQPPDRAAGARPLRGGDGALHHQQPLALLRLEDARGARQPPHQGHPRVRLLRRRPAA